MLSRETRHAHALSGSLTALASLADANCVVEPSIRMGSVGNGRGLQNRMSVGESEVLSHESHLFLWMNHISSVETEAGGPQRAPVPFLLWLFSSSSVYNCVLLEYVP